MTRRPPSTTEDGRPQLRWRLADDDGGRPDLLGTAQEIPGTGELAGLTLFHVRAGRVINRVPAASRMPFRWTINPYRGCTHACAYCFARPTHEYLGLDGGDDFDRRIVVKVNAVERVRAELRARGWTGESIAMGTNTDPYQPVEGRYRLTRGILGELSAAANPFSILTKSPLIERDIDVLTDAVRRARVRTALSVGTLDPAVWRASEPHTASPRRRLRAVERLNAAGVPCGVMLAPVLPELSDSDRQLDELVRAALDAGAVSITPIMLHLRRGVRAHYLERIAATHPAHAAEMDARYSSAYGPRTAMRDLAERVREMVARHGGLRRHPQGFAEPRFGPSRRGTARTAAPDAPDDRQMSLPIG